MLTTLSELKRLSIGATDGDLGSVEDVYFDAGSWTVRYLVVDTGGWLSGRSVLVSPLSVRGADLQAGRLAVALTRSQVEGSPHHDSVLPVSRAHEIELSRHYGYPYYWSGPYRWGLAYEPLLGVPPAPPAASAVEEEMLARVHESAESSLHSANAVLGWYIQAQDDDVGHLDDLLIDDRHWAIRYLIVDTRNWLPGRKVLLSPEWVRDVSWSDSKVFVDLPRRLVEGAPEYDPARPFDREHESRLHAHYGRPGYWESETYPTGDLARQRGVYTSACCGSDATVQSGDRFPRCARCGSETGWRLRDWATAA